MFFSIKTVSKDQQRKSQKQLSRSVWLLWIWMVNPFKHSLPMRALYCNSNRLEFQVTIRYIRDITFAWNTFQMSKFKKTENQIECTELTCYWLIIASEASAKNQYAWEKEREGKKNELNPQIHQAKFFAYVNNALFNVSPVVLCPKMADT